MTQPGMGVKTDLLADPIPVQVASVMAVNPPEKSRGLYGEYQFRRIEDFR